jgi:hypothetical protein
LDSRRPVIHDKSQQALSQISQTSSYLSIDDFNMWKGSSRVGEEIRQQFFFWIAKGFEARETRILLEFDKYMKTPENPFVLLACVQRMMLLYRRLRERYRSFAISKYPICSAVYLSNPTIVR